ncbi:MAG TPA: hypothetical protein VFB36_07310 [Nevskiaceae bacterium]|nr:hypothetical protein [Nevskiaceae bacterium]
MTLLGLFAHSFGRIYNLPVPFWLYVYGAAAALALSFVVVAYFVSAPVTPHAASSHAISFAAPRWLALCARALSVCALGLCIATGLFGTSNPFANFNMTCFWIVFVLGCTYLCALFGDVYAPINPWRILSRGDGVVLYPERLGYWPALALYVAFIWIELFGGVRPFSLSVALFAYTALNAVGVGVIGARDWFRYCEFFSVFFRLIGRVALLNRSDFQIERMSLVVFALFMLSSTAFDGLRDTVPWVNLFSMHLAPALTPLLGTMTQSYPAMHAFYVGWQTFALVVSPFVYLGVYAIFIAAAKSAARSDRSLRELMLRFAFTLLPIALAYNVTHYYTLLMTQGVKIVPLVSDPFGRGWNLFGTADWLRAPIIPNAGIVWHVQVALIVLGHIASVYLAHVEALRLFGDRRRATLSQLPMLGLMILFTTIGLWILAQPIQGGI